MGDPDHTSWSLVLAWGAPGLTRSHQILEVKQRQPWTVLGSWEIHKEVQGPHKEAGIFFGGGVTLL